MKTLIAAIALTIAFPVGAQTAPGGHADHAAPAAGHEGHEQHSDHKDCCKKADGAMKECCEKMKDGAHMACCEKHEKAEGHDGYQMNH